MLHILIHIKIIRIYRERHPETQSTGLNVGNSIFQASIASKHKRYRLKYQCKHEF